MDKIKDYLDICIMFSISHYKYERSVDIYIEPTRWGLKLIKYKLNLYGIKFGCIRVEII